MNEFKAMVKVFLAILVAVSPQYLTAQGTGDGIESDSTSGSEREHDPDALYRAQWVVSPPFLSYRESGGSPGAVDPFAAPESSETSVRVLKTARETLESAGITFPPGTSVTYSSRTRLLTVVNTLDQLDLVDAYLWCGCCAVEKQIYVFVEWIEVNAANYHDWMFENRITQDGTALRRQVQKWVKAGEGRIIETSALNTRSGQRSKTESHRFLLYPIGNHPPEVPEKVTLDGKGITPPLLRAAPTAIECRNVGVTTEVDAVLAADEYTIDLSLAPEIVARNGYSHWPPNADESQDTFSTPIFHTMKVSTQVTLHSGRYAILGTTRGVNADGETDRESIILSFVRGDVRSVGHVKEPSSPQPVKVENQ